MFFWNSLAFSMSWGMWTVWSLVALPFLNPACTSGSSQFMYCWSLAWGLLSTTLVTWGFTGGSDGKASAHMRETRVWSLGWEDPLEKEMAPHSSILAWRIPWTEEPGGLQSMGSQRVRHIWAISLSLMPSSYCYYYFVFVMENDKPRGLAHLWRDNRHLKIKWINGKANEYKKGVSADLQYSFWIN